MVLNDVFSTNGLLRKKFPQYQIREGQVKMASLVLQAITSKTSAVIEGATGVGKGFAYLIPTLMTGERVIVSTSNKNLQNQLDRKDLPTLKDVFGQDISWTVLKGKNNYFCYEHFEANKDEIRSLLTGSSEFFDFNGADALIQQISTWAGEETIGDLEFLPFAIPQRVRELIACDNQTTHERGSDGAMRCFATQARTRAMASQIILVNHTLLALDIQLRKETDGNAGILPTTDVVIIDEAHEFEKQAVLAFSDDISLLSLYHLLNWSIVKKAVPKKDNSLLIQQFKAVLGRYLPDKGMTYYSQKKVARFEGFEPVITGIQGIVYALKAIDTSDEKVAIKVREIIKEAQNFQKRLQDLMKEDDNMLRWAEAKDGTRGEPFIRLKSVPLDVSELLKYGLFDKKTVICTSATLSVKGKFDFFRQQVGMPEGSLELVVPSPFDYKKQALVYITDGSQDREWEVEQLLKMSKGRAFLLFTSYKDMNDAYDMISCPYPKFKQGQDGMTRQQLIDVFRSTPNAVLFATKSFWEGVDIQGEQLSLVVLWKIPFENPRDLVFSSKCEKIDQRAGRKISFITYAIPDACIKLKQGAGRLIRDVSDTGVIALMDARINTARYRDMIIDSLPPAYRTQQLEKVKSFFERTTI